MTYRFRNGTTEQVDDRFAEIDLAIRLEEQANRPMTGTERSRHCRERKRLGPHKWAAPQERHAESMREANAGNVTKREELRKAWETRRRKQES